MQVARLRSSSISVDLNRRMHYPYDGVEVIVNRRHDMQAYSAEFQAFITPTV